MIGRLKDLTLNRDGSQNLTVTVSEDFRNEYDRLRESEVEIKVRKYSRSRSLTANAYAWVLIDKISERTNVRKSEVYRNAIREIGGVSETVCTTEKMAKQVKAWWESKGLGWQAEQTESKLEGCVNLVLYCGSSEYDSAQMARLIELLIQDAEALGIPTITPDEESRLVSKWGKRNGESTEHNAGGT